VIVVVIRAVAMLVVAIAVVMPMRRVIVRVAVRVAVVVVRARRAAEGGGVQAGVRLIVQRRGCLVGMPVIMIGVCQIVVIMIVVIMPRLIVGMIVSGADRWGVVVVHLPFLRGARWLRHRHRYHKAHANFS